MGHTPAQHAENSMLFLMGRVRLSADIKYIALLEVQDYDCLQQVSLPSQVRL